MKCYFCNNDLDVCIKNYYSTFKCIDCNLIYVSKDKLSTFLNFYLNSLNISEYNKNIVLEKLDSSNSIDKFIPKNSKSCKLNWICNRKNCDIFFYNINDFKFWECNYKNYYCFYESNLIKAINKIIFKYKIQKIYNKVISLFIEGKSNGKK